MKQELFHTTIIRHYSRPQGTAEKRYQLDASKLESWT